MTVSVGVSLVPTFPMDTRHTNTGQCQVRARTTVNITPVTIFSRTNCEAGTQQTTSNITHHFKLLTIITTYSKASEQQLGVTFFIMIKFNIKVFNSLTTPTSEIFVMHNMKENFSIEIKINICQVYLASYALAVSCESTKPNCLNFNCVFVTKKQKLKNFEYFRPKM